LFWDKTLKPGCSVLPLMLYKTLVGLAEKLAATPKRLAKTELLAAFLKGLPIAELEPALLLLQGRVFPEWDSREVGMAARLAIRALAAATGFPEPHIEDRWRALGDLGDVAAELAGKKRQATLFQQELTVEKVLASLRKIATAEGEGTVNNKISLAAELLSNASAAEARSLMRAIIGELRAGLGEGTLRDAITWAFFGDSIGLAYDAKKNELAFGEGFDRKSYDAIAVAVQSAYEIANDLAAVAKLAKEHGIAGLRSVPLHPGRPIKAMLYIKATDLKDAFETVGRPAALEYKYDGFRMQIHLWDGKLSIYTRRLEDVTAQFPDVAEAVKASVHARTAIIEAEAVGVDAQGRHLPFQQVSQRIKRKHDIAAMARQFPVEVNLFDILFLNGERLLDKPFSVRRQLLQDIVTPRPLRLVLAAQKITADDAEAEAFYKESLAAGNEGIMMKSLAARYEPGARVGTGVKVKPVMESLDVVIVAAEWGEGKRAHWLSSFTLAIRDPDGGFREIGRMGTGVKEKEEEGTSFAEITELLRPHILGEQGREVRLKPAIVIEVKYEEIQASPTYDSGFALRFPRFVRLREDRSPDECSTTADVKRLYAHQRGRNG
jgi:DNA ligase-1